MLQILPIDANSQLIEAELDETSFQVGLDWNETASRWTLSLRNLDSALLLSGVPVLTGALLLRQVRNPDCPPGDFLAFTTPPGGRIGRQDFVTARATLFYLDPDEVAEVRAATIL